MLIWVSLRFWLDVRCAIHLKRERGKISNIKKKIHKNNCQKTNAMKEKKRKLKQAVLLTILNFLVIILLSSIVTQLSSLNNCSFGRHCQFLTTLNTLLLYYPTIVFFKNTYMIENLHLHQKIKIKMCPWMFITVLLTTDQAWKQTRKPLIGDWKET